jgi:hypothetical protein
MTGLAVASLVGLALTHASWTVIDIVFTVLVVVAFM